MWQNGQVEMGSYELDPNAFISEHLGTDLSIDLGLDAAATMGHVHMKVGDLGNFASNGYGSASPDGYGFLSVILTEMTLTAVFLLVIIGTTSKRAPAGFAPLAIGLTLALIHLISIPVSNTSVNPARSIAAAIYGSTEALAQLWVFLVFPMVGALIAGFLFKPLFDGVKKLA